MRNWIADFCTELRCSPDFAAALDAQLRARLIERIATDPWKEDFAMIPISVPGAEMRYDDDNVGHILTNLVGPNGYGWWVGFTWRCEAHPHERIMPENAVGPECRLVFEWEELEEEEMREAYAGPVGPPWSEEDDATMGYDPSKYPFAIEWWALAWPSLFLEVATSNPLTDEQIEVIGDAIDTIRGGWNTDDDTTGVMHSISTAERVDAQRCEIYIDFGSAGMEPIVRMLDALNGLRPDIPISKVVFRPSSSRTEQAP